MHPSKTYDFTRESYSDYHSFFNLSLTNSVVYNLLEDQTIIGAFICNDSKTFAQFIGEGKLIGKSSPWILRTVKRTFFTEDSEPYAEIKVTRPLLGSDKYYIYSFKEGKGYTFQYVSCKPVAENNFLVFRADLVNDAEIVCSLNNYQSSKPLFDSRKNRLQGTIEVFDNTKKEMVFILIQTLQLYFEMGMTL